MVGTVPAWTGQARGRGGIVTPEAVVLELETASVGSRAVAKIVDLAASGVGFMIIGSFGGLAGATGAVIVAVIGAFLVLFGYPVVCEGFFGGRTLGKAAMGLRVVTVEGAPCRFRHAAIRSALAIVDFFVPPVGVCAVLSCLLGRTDQRLGDRLAGTVVLRERSGAREARAVLFPPLPGYEGYVAGLDTSAVTPAQYEVLRSFLTRVHELAPGARASLAVRLANPIAVAMRHSPPPGMVPEAFLVSVAASYQMRHGGPAAFGWAPVPAPAAPPPYPPPPYPPSVSSGWST